MNHWATAAAAIGLWLWWARSEWVLAGYRAAREEDLS